MQLISSRLKFVQTATLQIRTNKTWVKYWIYLMLDWRLKYSLNSQRYPCFARWAYFMHTRLLNGPVLHCCHRDLPFLPLPSPSIPGGQLPCSQTLAGNPNLQASRAIVSHYLHFIFWNKIVHSLKTMKMSHVKKYYNKNTFNLTMSLLVSCLNF